MRYRDTPGSQRLRLSLPRALATGGECRRVHPLGPKFPFVASTARAPVPLASQMRMRPTGKSAGRWSCPIAEHVEPDPIRSMPGTDGCALRRARLALVHASLMAVARYYLLLAFSVEENG